jgi:hypothetical protein
MSIFALSSHRTIKYLQGEKQACVLVNRSQCRKLECISEVDTYYEVELVKAKIRRFISVSGKHNILLASTRKFQLIVLI